MMIMLTTRNDDDGSRWIYIEYIWDGGSSGAGRPIIYKQGTLDWTG